MTLHRTIGLEHHSAELAIITLGGLLDQDARPEVANTLASAAEQPTVEHVVVDLSDAGQGDPSVVNVVVQSTVRVTVKGTRLELVIPVRVHMLRSLFETVGPTGIATVHETPGRTIATLTAACDPWRSRRAA